MKKLCMVKQKMVETLQVWDKVVEFHGLEEKRSCKIKMP